MIITDPVSRPSYTPVEALPGSVLEGLGTEFSRGLLGEGTAQMIRRRRRQLFGEGIIETPSGFPFPLPLRLQVTPDEELPPTITREEANKRGQPYGLKFGDAVDEYTLNDLIERKQAEARRNVTLAQLQGQDTYGLLTTAEILGIALDPVNVASAFVPVVGEARFAAMAAQRGLTQARLTRGAVEGLVGAAATEPIVFQGMTEEQFDYGLLDALVNVAFGSVLGGGLHVLGGAARDITVGRPDLPEVGMSERLQAVSPETRNAALRTAVSDITAFGRVHHVDPLLQADPDFRAFGQWETASSPSVLTRNLGETTFQFQAHMIPRATYEAMQTATMRIEPTPTRVPYVARNGKRPSFDSRAKAEAAAERIEREQGVSVEVQKRGDRWELARNLSADFLRDDTGRPLSFDAERFAKREIDRILNREPTLRNRIEPVKIGDRWMVAKDAEPDDIKAMKRSPDDITPAKGRSEAVEAATALVQADHRAVVEAALARSQPVPARVMKDYPDLEVQAREAGLVAPDPRPAVRIGEEVRGRVERREHSLADPATSERADAILSERASDDVDALLEDANQNLDDTLRSLGIERENIANDPEVLSAGEALTRAEKRSEAIRAAGLCQMRRAG